jgi:hypothetical protein
VSRRGSQRGGRGVRGERGWEIIVKERLRGERGGKERERNEREEERDDNRGWEAARGEESRGGGRQATCVFESLEGCPFSEGRMRRWRRTLKNSERSILVARRLPCSSRVALRLRI